MDKKQLLEQLSQQFDIPSWGKWLAKDADGKWWAYSVEPLQHANGWYENEVGQYQYIGRWNIEENWPETLLAVENKI